MKKTYLNLKRANLKQNRILTKQTPRSSLMSIKVKHAIIATRRVIFNPIAVKRKRAKTTALIYLRKAKVRAAKTMVKTKAKAEGAKASLRLVPLHQKEPSGVTAAKSLPTLPTIAGRK